MNLKGWLWNTQEGAEIVGEWPPCQSWMVGWEVGWLPQPPPSRLWTRNSRPPPSPSPPTPTTGYSKTPVPRHQHQVCVTFSRNEGWRQLKSIKVMFSSFLFRVSALVRPLLRRHESPQDGLRLLAGGKSNQIKRPEVWVVKINKSVSWPKYYEYEALSWRSMMSLSTNNCDILSTW